MADSILNPELASMISEAERTGWLHLSFLNLNKIPHQVFSLKNLVRLDIGFNHIDTLPTDIGKLTKLEQLWINNNPLRYLPKEIGLCRNLTLIDAQDTLLSELPAEVGKLTGLTEVDLRNVPLKADLLDAYKDGTSSLLQYLTRCGERLNLKETLTTSLRNGKYREVSDSNEGQALVQELVEKIFIKFADPDEQKNLIRNAERLFPEDIRSANPDKIKETFVSLKRENEKKKLSAELELKLRRIYFDAINPAR